MFNEQQQIIIGASVHNTHILTYIGTKISRSPTKADFKTDQLLKSGQRSQLVCGTLNF